jgi:hypothetical protein
VPRSALLASPQQVHLPAHATSDAFLAIRAGETEKEWSTYG